MPTIPSNRISPRRAFRVIVIVAFISTAAVFIKKRGNEVKRLLSPVEDLPYNMGEEQLVVLARKNLSPKITETVNEKVITLDHQGRERILVKKQKNGKKIFRVEGLPQSKLKEVRKFVLLTTPATKVKKNLSSDIEQIYDRRRQRLIKSCKGQRRYHWNDSMQLISAPSKDLTVCAVQKAGSSSWHRVVYSLRVPGGNWTGDCHSTNRNHGIALPQEVKNQLMKSRHGTRVLTVRHPFARIISGWNDKFNKNHMMISTRILTSSPGIEHYIGIHEPDEDHIIAFEDFVQYLVDKGVRNVDVHFRSIEELCSPCDFPYDYITKAETTTQNLWWVLDRVGASMPSFSKRVASGSGATNVGVKTDPWGAEKKVISAFFRKVPIDTVRRLMQMYEPDFLRYGYTFDVETMWAGDVGY